MSRCNTKPKSSTVTGAKSARSSAGAKSTGSPGCATGSQGSSAAAALKLPSACAPMQTSSGSAATGASAAHGSSPIGRRSSALWDELMPRAVPLIERFGQKVAAGALGVDAGQFRAFEDAMWKRGVRYNGPRIHKRSPEQTAQAIREAVAWEAAGRPGVAPGVAAAVPASPAAAQAGRQVVVPAGVRITVAPPFVDRRFAPDPGHVGMFSLAGIGRDVQTGRAWA